METELKNFTLSQLVTAYNQVSPIPVRKFSDRKIAVIRTQRALDAVGMVAWVRNGEVGTGTPSRTPRSKRDRIIRVLVSNPKVPGTRAHDRFAAYRDGMTIEEYYVAMGSVKTAWRALAWDLERGFIRIEE